MMRPILIAAGGTGGHLFPAEALTEELTRRGRPVVFVTDSRGKGFARDYANTKVTRIHSGTFAGGPWARVRALGEIAAGTAQAWRLIGRERPAAAVGFGGYPSLPAMAAAAMRGVPSAIHESNAVLGRVNRLFAPRARAIASGFPIARGLKARDARKVTVTGNPVRPGIAAQAGAAYAAPDAGGPLRVVVLGGSQGAKVMSDVVPAALSLLPAGTRARLEVTQQARPEDTIRARDAYRAANIRASVESFFHDVPERLKNAHVAICRSGASTCAELTAMGRPAILVPYPFAMDDHQSANARVLADAGAALFMAQPEFTADNLSRTLAELFAAPERLARMAAAAKAMGKPGAVAALADLVEGIAS